MSNPLLSDLPESLVAKLIFLLIQSRLFLSNTCELTSNKSYATRHRLYFWNTMTFVLRFVTGILIGVFLATLPGWVAEVRRRRALAAVFRSVTLRPSFSPAVVY